MKQNQENSRAMELLEAQTRDWGRPLSTGQLDLLYRYARLLFTYTAANVIGSKDIETILLDHVLDSLSCLSVQEATLPGTIIDVGAGGGLPGIPIAVSCPESEVTLLEATRKKVVFLESVRNQLGLLNVNVLHARAEDAQVRKGLREQYESAVSRALASLPVVLEYCAPFVKQGGKILAMKGRLEDAELLAGQRAATKVGAELLRVTRVYLHAELQPKQRYIVVSSKTAPTPKGYPRRVGLAKKRPLGD